MQDPNVIRLNAFRSRLHSSFPKRRDALLGLTDALSGNANTSSPVALSQSSLFSRGYSSLHDAVDNFFHAGDPNKTVEQRRKSQLERLNFLKDFLPKPVCRPFTLLATDATPVPRQFALTLEDRHIVYSPNPAPGNNPIEVGHQYSTIVVLPEKKEISSSPWAIPLSIEQIPSHQTGNSVAAEQIRSLLTDKDLPSLNGLTVNVADSLYCAVSFLGAVRDLENLITVVRCPNNRIFYFPPELIEQKAKGHPIWFGNPFSLRNPETWCTPGQTVEHSFVAASGKINTIKLNVWENMRMRGKRNIPMHREPFTLIRCCQFGEDGSEVFNRPLWLIVFGKRRQEISHVDAWLCYRQRYDMEHFFRFGKRRLLMGNYQTSISEHEENWCEIVGIAYFQLWVASPLAASLPNPWERYSLPKNDAPLPSPSMTQRSFERIIRQVGAQVPLPKPRGKSPGRLLGQSQPRRPRLEVVIKGSKKAKKKAA